MSLSNEERARAVIMGDLQRRADLIALELPLIPLTEQSLWMSNEMIETVNTYPKLNGLVIAFYLGTMVGANLKQGDLPRPAG